MRIVAGRLGGRIFAAPHGHRTHPMSDKMRGALFNILGDIAGLSVLDAFAGSGALSFEAISRGAANALAIELDKPAQRAISENIESLGVSEQVQLLKANARAWLNRSQTCFDLVLLDPPYDYVQVRLLEPLAKRVSPGGRLVLSWPGHERPPQLPPLELITSKNYGDGSLHIYRLTRDLTS